MSAINTVREQLPAVVAYTGAVEKLEDDERAAALRNIGPLIHVVREFYRAFFAEYFKLQILKLSYREKRMVARMLVHQEHALEGDDDPVLSARLRLAASFEDLCDALHGDIDFGYSGEEEDYPEFYGATYPAWLDALADWLDAEGDADLAQDVRHKLTRFKGATAEPV